MTVTIPIRVYCEAMDCRAHFDAELELDDAAIEVRTLRRGTCAEISVGAAITQVPDDTQIGHTVVTIPEGWTVTPQQRWMAEAYCPDHPPDVSE